MKTVIRAPVVFQKSFSEVKSIAGPQFTYGMYRLSQRRNKIGNYESTQNLRYEVRDNDGVPLLHIQILISILVNYSYPSCKNQRGKDLNPIVQRFYKLFLTEQGIQVEKLLFDKTQFHDKKQIISMKENREKELLKRNSKHKRKRIESEDEQLSEGQPTQPLIKTDELDQLIKDSNLSIDPYFENLTQKELEDKPTMERKRRRLDLDDDEYVPEEIPKEDSRFEQKEEEGDFEIVNVSDGNNPWMNQILRGEFFDVDNAPHAFFYGTYQLLQEKRITYFSKSRLFFCAKTLFPFIDISDSNLDSKTKNLIPPACRTDICDQCDEADEIFLKMQRLNLKFEELSDIEQLKLKNWKIHITRADHQHEQLQLQILGLSPGECSLQIDYKENFMLAMLYQQMSRAFFTQRPVTCLSAVCYKIDENGNLLKAFITILSLIISHTGGFTLQCLSKMFESPFFNDVTSCNWFSVGGPHFRNQQVVCALLRPTQALIPRIQFTINFTEHGHGKGAVDSLFGQYSNQLFRNKDKGGIRSIVALQEELQQIGFINGAMSPDSCSHHEVMIFDTEQQENEIDYVPIMNFKQFLSFKREGEEIIAQNITNDPSNKKYKFKINIKQRPNKNKLKRSTAQVDDDDEPE
ncbi:MAG: hypothetical protein EZS28_033509 [Streblomastix strix]|uniref:Uncharacterized protein n=1 Tax=Streblomastix strix TaxID=222440 RepID=A0A5J4UL74_9EUKA|nr:MAG: hypothetical protein EZS28_033509 [Streblomastix strix]